MKTLHDFWGSVEFLAHEGLGLILLSSAASNSVLMIDIHQVIMLEFLRSHCLRRSHGIALGNGQAVVAGGSDLRIVTRASAREIVGQQFGVE